MVGWTTRELKMMLESRGAFKGRKISSSEKARIRKTIKERETQNKRNKKKRGSKSLLYINIKGL